MSIASEISRIAQNVSDALTAIANKGVTVPQGSNSDDLATLIAQISGGGTPAISVVDTADSHGGTVRTITALDISDTTAVAADVLNSKWFYTAQGVKTQGTATGGGGTTPTIQSLSVTPSTSQQTFNAAGVDGYKPVVVAAMPSGSAGTPTASKGTVSNHSVTVTPSVTNTTGYITGGTKTGTAVTVTASELVSGSETKTENGTYDVTNLASLVVNVSGGSSDVATGMLTVASNVNTSTNTAIATTSTIGFTPTKFFFWKDSRTATNNHVHQATFTSLGSYYIRTMTRYSSNALSTSGNTNNWTTQTAGYLYFNSNTVYFRSSSSYILSAGTWHWVAVK